jgi:hypothetical protein
MIMRILILFLFLSFHGVAQFQKMDSLGNFYVIDYKLVWQKYYLLEDKAELDRLLKANDFTADLDILKFTKSAMTKPYRLTASSLPEYAQHDYEAFLVVDFIGNRFRVSIKQITFPDFIEKVVYNGMKQNNSRGTLEQYILRQDGSIKRNNANLHVLNSFDTAFSEVFDPMGGISYE